MENKYNQKVNSRNISLFRLGIFELENLFLHQATEGLPSLSDAQTVNNWARQVGPVCPAVFPSIVDVIWGIKPNQFSHHAFITS